VSWDDLRYLEALVRQGGAPKAARELGVAASTVYRRIAALEKEIGSQCIVRGATDIELTETGRTLLGIARRTQTELVEARGAARERSESVRGVIGLTTVEEFLPLLVDPLAELAARYPELRIELHLADSGPSVRRREVDMAIGVMHHPPSGLWGRRLFRIEFGVFGTATQASASSLRWIVRGSSVQHAPEAQWERKQAELIAIESESRIAMLTFVRNGVGVALIARRLAALYPELEEVESFRDSSRELTRDAWLLVHPDRRTDARVRVLSKALMTLSSTRSR
jgi:DNA-binding transcriptional LysR family regulator